MHLYGLLYDEGNFHGHSNALFPPVRWSPFLPRKASSTRRNGFTCCHVGRCALFYFLDFSSLCWKSCSRSRVETRDDDEVKVNHVMCWCFSEKRSNSTVTERSVSYVSFWTLISGPGFASMESWHVCGDLRRGRSSCGRYRIRLGSNGKVQILWINKKIHTKSLTTYKKPCRWASPCVWIFRLFSVTVRRVYFHFVLWVCACVCVCVYLNTPILSSCWW